MAIPQISLLSRDFSKATTYFQSKKAYELRKNNKYTIHAKKSDLAYPWQLEMTLTRTGNSKQSEVVLSSRYAAIYANLSHTFKLKEKDKTTNITKSGLAVVRANQTEGLTPLTSHRPDVIVFDYQLPINQPVEIRILGDREKTSLYVNGKLIETKPLQMLCPLAFVGSDKEPVFNGIVEDVTIKTLDGEHVN